ncbi:Glycosyltransferase Family 8 protein [Gigaspora rosea]|uniref:Glycosyltransferase Family 8 protein n=1 Tax=Gigaspora rosea TaxID=44941 RepID=A0A397W7P0_9GLOM|nr:Glycosyltransferase Family 8 protein [Gigaspora rosea]
MILQPSITKFEEIHKYLTDHKRLDELKFADQDLLNEFYKGNWKSLPYIFNAPKTFCKCHSPVWSDKDVKNIHYIGDDKPWKEDITRKMRRVERGDIWILNNWWWKVYNDEE